MKKPEPPEDRPFPTALLHEGKGPSAEWQAARASWLRQHGYESDGTTSRADHWIRGKPTEEDRHHPLVLSECTSALFRLTPFERMVGRPEEERFYGWGPMEMWLPWFMRRGGSETDSQRAADDVIGWLELDGGQEWALLSVARLAPAPLKVYELAKTFIDAGAKPRWRTPPLTPNGRAW